MINKNNDCSDACSALADVQPQMVSSGVRMTWQEPVSLVGQISRFDELWQPGAWVTIDRQTHMPADGLGQF